MDEAEYAYDMGIIKLREPIRVWFTNKFDQMPVADLAHGSELMASKGEQAGLSERALEALESFGINSVGQLMDYFTRGEAEMVKAIPNFGAVAMNETREALRLLGMLGAIWPADRLITTTVGRIIFNRHLPEPLWYVNEVLDRKDDYVLDPSSVLSAVQQQLRLRRRQARVARRGAWRQTEPQSGRGRAVQRQSSAG